MSDFPYDIMFLILLPIVAFFYASVGHGGASGYLALMAMFSSPIAVMKPTALILNLFVSGVAFYHYYKRRHFDKKLFLSFAISSIPLAYLGGRISVDPKIYKITLGVLLIFAVVKMLGLLGDNETKEVKKFNWSFALIIGAIIGFFSGLIGIGGGIILSPIILLLHWGKMKVAAAVSALFIWVNSLSGLLGQLSTNLELDFQVVWLIVLVLIGGFAGAYFGSQKLNNKKLRLVLALVLLMASIKLIFV
ncbi:MAG: sulfite exporter TauE/SafE family protein [Flavobacteriaceae bacterium]|nr:sulfite exporter TauE/SafE family protein [Flavobacteriaceae bacterium]